MQGSKERDHRLDEYLSDTRFCGDCNRQRAFVDGQCVACRARGHAIANGIIAHTIRGYDRMKSAAFREFCRVVED
jgi:molybdenum cofactor biosynthesis enzyme MoaA